MNGLFASPREWAFPWDLFTAARWPLGALNIVAITGFAWTFLARRRQRVKSRSLFLLTGGSATLLGATLLPFGEEAVLAGVPYLMAGWGEKAFFLIVALAGSCLAAGNRLRAASPERSLPRWLVLGGALTLLAAYGLPLREDGAPVLWSCRAQAWQESWPLATTLTAILVYGLFALLSALTHRLQRPLRLLLSALAQLLLAWIPVAFFLLQREDSWLNFFLARDALALTLATVKLCAIVYGALFVTTVGLAGWFAKATWDSEQPARQETKEPELAL